MLMTTVHSSSPRPLQERSHLHRSAITDFSAKTRVVNGGVTLTPNSLPHCAQDVPTHRSFCESGHSRAPKPLLSLPASQRTQITSWSPTMMHRGQGRYHCAQNPSSIILGATVSGCRCLAAPRQSSDTVMPSLKTAQTSRLANAAGRQDTWFFIVLHMKSVMPTRLLERMNLK